MFFSVVQASSVLAVGLGHGLEGGDLTAEDAPLLVEVLRRERKEMSIENLNFIALHAKSHLLPHLVELVAAVAQLLDAHEVLGGLAVLPNASRI